MTKQQTPAQKAWVTRRANGDNGSSAGKKAWETRQANAQAAEHGSAPLPVTSITKGLSVRWKLPGTKSGEGFRPATVDRRVNATCFHVKFDAGQGINFATARLGELYAA